jgi:hypothetical protein
MSVVHNSAMKHDFSLEVSDEAQATVLNSHIEAFKYGVTPTYDYRPVIASKDVAEMALYMPSILLVFNASLDILAKPEVATQLPQEVIDRKETGIVVIGRLAKLVTQSDDLVDAHLQHFDLSQEERDKLRTRDGTINTFASAILNDTAPIMGGAALFLTQEGYEQGDTRDTVGRSPLARFISKTSQPEGSAKRLGDRYCEPSCYQLVEDAEMPTVDFSADAKSIFKGRVGNGCPARRVALQQTRCNLFTEAWRRTAAYLLQDGFQLN